MSKRGIKLRTLWRIGTVGCFITAGGVCLNDEKKGPNRSLGNDFPGAQHAERVKNAIFGFLRKPVERYRSCRSLVIWGMSVDR